MGRDFDPFSEDFLSVFKLADNNRYLGDSSVASNELRLKHQKSHADLRKFWPDSVYIDTHCHLDLIYKRYTEKHDFSTLKTAYSESWSPNYGGCITDFCFPDVYMKDETFWDHILFNDDVWAAIGCHPHQANVYNDVVESFITERAKRDKVVAIGELGLDFSSNNNVPVDQQKEALIKQLELAVRLNMPVVLHCRESADGGQQEAADICFETLKTKVPHSHPIHWHCFMSSFEVSKKWSDYFPHLYFGLTPGIYNPTPIQEEFCQKVPLNRLLIETDAPFFLPKHYRTAEFGSLDFDHPGLGALVAIKLAEIRNQDVPEIFAEIFKNTKNLYKIHV